MRILPACTLIAEARRDAVIVATMGAMLAFDQLRVVDGRINSVPLMGGAASLGLGLALARPDRTVIMVDGDASLLMQLGGLVGVAGECPANLHHFLINNGVQFAGMYNLPVAGAGRVDFPGLARAAGYAVQARFDTEAAFGAALRGILAAPGPSFTELVVEPEPSTFSPTRAQPEVPDRQFTRMGEEAVRLAAWLQTA